LRRVVEMAGMLDHCDFVTQAAVDSDEGRLRPDLLVRLPAGKIIVVDAKTPLDGYLQAIEAPDEQTRKARLADHARQVRAHLTALGRKSYWEQFDYAPEFAVLFLPGECFFSAALESDPSLIEFGVGQNIILATPTTLIALLRAVAYGWRQENLAQNAAEISALGKELFKRLSDMGDHLNKVGKGLERAVEAYNGAVGSFEARVMVSARKFADLKTAPLGVEIAELEPVEKSVRAVQGL
jgi:DNA recombination protein RmuC